MKRIILKNKYFLGRHTSKLSSKRGRANSWISFFKTCYWLLQKTEKLNWLLLYNDSTTIIFRRTFFDELEIKLSFVHFCNHLQTCGQKPSYLEIINISINFVLPPGIMSNVTWLTKDSFKINKTHAIRVTLIQLIYQFKCFIWIPSSSNSILSVHLIVEFYLEYRNKWNSKS